MKKYTAVFTMTLTILAGALIFAGCFNPTQPEMNYLPVINELFWSDSDAIEQVKSSSKKLKDCTNLNNELKRSTKKEGSDTEYAEGQDFPYTMILSMIDNDKNTEALYISLDKSFPEDKTVKYTFSQKYEEQSSAWEDFRFTDITQSSVTLYAYVEDAKKNKSKVFSVDLTFTNVE